MSDSPSVASSRHWIRPGAFLAGFVIGLAALALAGRAVTRKSWHQDFTRIHPMIGPESMYEPSIGELRAVVRSVARRDQILVVVGGNSILQGVGQPPNQLWTRRLQYLLGDEYAVVNLAFRGSSPTDGGALVAESLRDEYPRQIYIANVAPLQAANAAGGVSYRFLLLDAYFKNLLLPWPARDQELARFFSEKEDHAARMERKLSAQLDAALHFHDFWNWWSSTQFFTFATTLAPRSPEAFWPRNRFKDSEPDFLAAAAADRYYSKPVAADLLIAQLYTRDGYEKAPDGTWRVTDAAMAQFNSYATQAFPNPLKKRTLILISRNSPFYTRQLTADQRNRDEVAGFARSAAAGG